MGYTCRTANYHLGVADAMRRSRYYFSMDFTEYLARDYDDIQFPVNAVRLRYVRNKWSAEAILILSVHF